MTSASPLPSGQHRLIRINYQLARADGSLDAKRRFIAIGEDARDEHRLFLVGDYRIQGNGSHQLWRRVFLKNGAAYECAGFFRSEFHAR